MAMVHDLFLRNGYAVGLVLSLLLSGAVMWVSLFGEEH